jgi:hypothetical protein
MSHITSVKTEIKSLPILAAACAKLGLELKQDQKSFKWYSRPGQCDHAIVVPGNSRAYEVGVVRNENTGEFSLKFDEYAGGYGLIEKIGTGAKLLKQEYGAEVARQWARRRGYRTVENRGADGKLRIVAQIPNR